MDKGLCSGCQRDIAQIASWGQLGPEQQQDAMDTVLTARRERQWPFLGTLVEVAALMDVLHPLYRLPQGPGWNHAQLKDVLPAVPPKLAAVLVGLVPREGGTQVILTRRTDTLRSHAGQVGFPGGRIEEEDRHPVAAALRECQEEIGLDPSQVAPIGYLDPFITISNYRVLPVVAAVDPGFVAVPNPDEVAEVFEVPLSYLMDPSAMRARSVEWQGRLRTVLEYDWPTQRIWGATAAILSNLQQRLQQTWDVPS